MDPNDDVRAQFDAAMRRAELSVDESRRDVMFNAFCQVLKWSDTVRRFKLDPTVEPSGAFSTDPHGDDTARVVVGHG